MFEVSLSFSPPVSLYSLQINHKLTKQNTGQWKRALVSALSVGLGAIGGVTGYVLEFFILQVHLCPSSETTTTTDGKCQLVIKIDPWYFEPKINPIIHPESRRVLPQRDSSW